MVIDYFFDDESIELECVISFNVDHYLENDDSRHFQPVVVDMAIERIDSVKVGRIYEDKDKLNRAMWRDHAMRLMEQNRDDVEVACLESRESEAELRA